MTFRVAPDAGEHTKLRRAGLPAVGLWTLAGAWSSAQRIDGFVPREVVRTRWDRRLRRASKLVQVELWLTDVDQHGEDGFRFVTSDGLCSFSHRPPNRAAIPAAVRAAVYERDDYACRECGSELDLTLDHVWPRLFGGQDDMSNLQTLCRSCNSRKGARV